MAGRFYMYRGGIPISSFRGASGDGSFQRVGRTLLRRPIVFRPSGSTFSSQNYCFSGQFFPLKMFACGLISSNTDPYKNTVHSWLGPAESLGFQLSNDVTCSRKYTVEGESSGDE